MKILFLCHGNICRSPMAEFVFKNMVKEQGLSDRFRIFSAGVSPEELGNDIYPPAKAQLRQHGVPFSPHSAHVITSEEYRSSDMVIAMDRANLRWLQRITGDLSKVSLLLDYTDHPRDVADPWYCGNFDQTWKDIKNGCSGLLRKILSDM